jgi:hypothetical protein
MAPKIKMVSPYETTELLSLVAAILHPYWLAGVDQGDLCHLECFEGVKSFDDFGVNGLACDPSLVLLGIHAAPLDYAEAGVDNVAVGHREVGASCECRAGAEAENKCVKTVSRMPVGRHMPTVRFAILRRSLSVVVDTPHKHVDKNDVWFAKAPL